MALFHVSMDIESDRDGDNLELFLEGLLAGRVNSVESIWTTEI